MREQTTRAGNSRRSRRGHGRKGRTLAVTAALTLSVLAVSSTGAASSAGAADRGGPDVATGTPPVALGPQPALFSLNDDQGVWYNTGTDILGTSSLAVAEMPTLASAGASAPGVARVVGGGNLTGDALRSAVNTDLDGISSAEVTGGTLGDLGFDVTRMLNLDRLRAAVAAVLPQGDARIAEVDRLADGLAADMSAAPAEKAYALQDSPRGAALMSLLQGIRSATSTSLMPVTINFNVDAANTDTAHTATSLIWPDGAQGMPFDQPGPWIGDKTVQLTTPGLYAFACKVHPYMIGAVVVDDPLTPGVDFGKKLRVASRGLDVPSTANVIAELAKEFFIITAPSNWKRYSETEAGTWDPQFTPAPILAYDGTGAPQLIPDLDLYMKNLFHMPMTVPQIGQKPAVPGVGEVWFDTQMEKYAGKTKSGAATLLNVQNWQIERKIAAPQINMNNPHNMWTDKDEKYLYQTEWFNNKVNVFDRGTGELIRQLEVGPSPTHVMTSGTSDKLYISLGGGAGEDVISPGATHLERLYPAATPNEKIALPHAQWVTGDGKTLMMPNVNLFNATVMDMGTGKIKHEATGEFPIATGFTPPGDKAYIANFLGQSVSCISLKKDACFADDGSKVHSKEIDMWADYDAMTGPTGPFGGLPVQIPVAPDNSAMVVANIFSANLMILDPKTDKVVKYLPCDPGCHGINFGAKKGGGYYAYVTSKFANTLEIIDTDPNGDGNPADAAVVGKIVTDPAPGTVMDDAIIDYSGMGGQGVLPIPLAYEGWVEHAPRNAVNKQLTCRQLNPVKFKSRC